MKVQNMAYKMLFFIIERMNLMEVIGEKLKTSREEKGLSLDEVSEDLKISVKDLENIESGNRKAFQDVFTLKQYIRDYAKYLGLDYENLVEEFNEFIENFINRCINKQIRNRGLKLN